jgi:Abortive infection alpha
VPERHILIDMAFIVTRMSGGEIVPAAKIAVKALGKAVDNKPDRAALQKLAADSPNMKAAAESHARRVAVKEAVLLKVYQPLARFLGVSREYFDTGFHVDMAEKVADIPDEHLVTPSPSVAIPAMQGLAYSIGEPDLKEMYLSLLATATDDRVAESAHPSFAEVIRQLSPREASLLLEVLGVGVVPLVRLGRRAEEGMGESVVVSHLIPLENVDTHEVAEEPSLAVWIDNWARLGLVEADYIRSLVAEERYGWVERRPEFARAAEEDPRGTAAISVGRGILRATDFGQRFLQAVSYDGVGLTGAPGASDATPPRSPGGHETGEMG